MALLKLCELTAFLAIALLPALATIYAIVVSLMRNVLSRASQEVVKIEKLKADAAEKFKAQLQDAQDKTSKGAELNKVVSELDMKRIEYEKQFRKEERELKRTEQNLSLKGFFVLPGALICLSLVVLLFAIVEASPSQNGHPVAELAYAAGVILISLAIWRVVVAVATLDKLVRHPEERESAEVMLGRKLEELLGLKNSEFEVGFASGAKRVPRMTIQKGKPSPLSISVINKSVFAAQEASVELALPSCLSVQANEPTAVARRPETVPLYPGGVKVYWKIGLFGSWNTYELGLAVTGSEAGSYTIYVFVSSTTHRVFGTTFQLDVE